MTTYNELIFNSVSNLVISVIIVIIAILSFHILKKRKTTIKQINKLKSRIIYISIIIFFLIKIKIWLGGITNLFTMLSLVAAGLIIVNKETVMNLVGWIIINWRSLFSEGDYIQIQGQHGYITEVKLFYFRMYETTEHGDKKTTGKLLKFPNSIVITSIISTFTSDENIMLHKVPFLLNTEQNVLKIRDNLDSKIKKIIANKYSFDEDFSKSSTLSKNKLKQCGIYNFAPNVEIKTVADKENIVNLQAYFYCCIDDKKK